MGVRYENQCVGCPPERGCLGSACPNRNVAITVCDRCGDDIVWDSHEVDGEDLCDSCYEEEFGGDVDEEESVH